MQKKFRTALLALFFMPIVMISTAAADSFDQKMISLVDNLLFGVAIGSCYNLVNNIEVLTDEQAMHAAIGAGVVGGMLTGGWLHRKLGCDNARERNGILSVSAYAGIGAGVVAGSCAYYILKGRVQQYLLASRIFSFRYRIRCFCCHCASF